MIKIQRVSIRRVVLLAVFLLPLTITAKAQYLSLNKNELQKLATLIDTSQSVKRAYKALENLAGAALKQQPNPVDTIISEGHLASDPKKIKTQKALADIDKIHALAYTYSISHKPDYFKKCVAYIMAWAKVNHGTGNPINDTKLDPLFEGYDLIKEEMTASERNTVDIWLDQVARAEIESPRFRSGKKSVYNNWNSHRIKIVGNIAYLLKDKNYQLFADTSLKSQILKNLYANGSGMDFEERDALHYHIYTLEPLLKIATVAKRATGTDYFTYVSPSGSSIQKSVEFLVPFVTGRKVHHEFVHSKVPFDRQRAENKEPGYIIGANFKPKTAAEVLSYAAYFDPGYTAIVKSLLNPQDIYSEWQSVLNIVRN
jgi:hypothetical protein